MSETEPLDDRRDPLAAMRSRWLICLILAIVGLGGGVLASSHHKTETTAEARLVVGSQDLSSYQVAGYAVASQALAANYARYIESSSSSTKVLQDALGSSIGKLSSITSSPIPNSNVVRIEATASSAAVAKKAAQAVSDNLRKQANATTGGPTVDQLLAAHEDLDGRRFRQQSKVDKLQSELSTASPADQSAAEAALEKATAHLSSLQLMENIAGLQYQQAATKTSNGASGLTEIQPAAVTGNDHRRTVELYGITGLIVGLGLGLVIANLLGPRRASRRVRRRRKADERARQAAQDDVVDRPRETGTVAEPASEVPVGSAVPGGSHNAAS